MRRMSPALPLLAALAACSPSPPPAQSAASAGSAGRSAPTNATLGSAEWYAWVDQTLAVSEDGHGPDRGSAEWNAAVQRKLGQEAPQSRPGSPEWQQAVDALLRARVAAP